MNADHLQFLFGVVITILCASISNAADETISLEKLLAVSEAGDAKPKIGNRFFRLEPEWVGDITSTEKKTRKLRLEYGGLFRGKIELARGRKVNYAFSGLASVYMAHLPRTEDLKSIKTAEELESHFGESQDWTSVWGSTGRHHWTMGWTFVTCESET